MFAMMSHFAKRSRRRLGTLTLRAAFAAVALSAGALAAGLPPGFVYLRDIDPSIVQDMRYAGPDNFTGQPLPGYDAPECVLKREVAQALRQVQADLARQNLGLIVYDCYRPERAVAAFARWARGKDAPGAPTKRFYPQTDKLRLFSLGYIAAHSAHSTGNAVDLALVPREAPPPPAYDAHARYGACIGPAKQRAPDAALDFGTGFDCFDEKSFTASAAITREEARRRALLVAAMRRRGFHNYFREWWHFSYGTRGAYYDFPIRARAR